MTSVNTTRSSQPLKNNARDGWSDPALFNLGIRN